MTKLISYTKLESTLAKIGAQLNAAETHGLLTGILSLNTISDKEAWRTTLLENLDCETPSKSQWGVFSAATTQNGPLLPEDDLPLADRIDALGYWCRGYLSGLGLIGITKEDLGNATIKELVADISQIAHVSMETDASEEDENNYMELVEYVKVAVQNIQVELVERSRILH